MKIINDSLFVIDLDGTLVYSDEANFLSYQKAMFVLLNMTITKQTIGEERFTYNILKLLFKNINETMLIKIKNAKQIYYTDFLDKTIINNNLINILLKYKNNRKILLTNSNKKRDLQLINYHKLDFFDNYFFNTKGNKFENLIDFFHLNPEKIVVYENEDEQILNAIKCNIIQENIIKVVK